MKLGGFAALLLLGLACSEATALSPVDTDPADDTDVVDAGLVMLNELLPSNGAGAQDESGDRDDWIEIFNGRAAAVDLTGWSLVDGSGVDPWLFPSGTHVDPGEHLIVWCDDEEDGPLHATFKLSADGEAVSLLDPTATSVDEASFGALDKDVSWARTPDGGDTWIEATPTYDAPNP